MRKRTDWIVIHCSATPPHMDIDAKTIDRWHRQQGWLGIGYHWVIRRDGTVEPGRNLMEPGAHVYPPKGINSTSIGICLVGGVDDNMKPVANFTQRQWESLNRLVSDMQKRFPGAKVVGHNYFNKSRACPSFDVNKWLTTREPVGTVDTFIRSDPLLKRGYSGPAVKTIQKILGITVDGIFGPETEAAVKMFQRRNNLVVDGVVGPNTWRSLRLFQEKGI